jgi:alpha-L-rhamnosidase
MKLDAKWIWKKQAELQPYNQAIVVRRAFRLGAVRSARVAVTADCWYRLLINGRWICDGPARSWPEHHQVDVLDVTPYLVPGANEIRVIARYFGVGTFHQRPQQPGLLLQLEAQPVSGKIFRVVTDASWQAALYAPLVSNTPKIAPQMEPFEQIDARRDRLSWSKAAVVCAAHGGPWKGLKPRDCALLTLHPVPLKACLGAGIAPREGMAFTFPVARLLHPGVIEANRNVNLACAIATMVVSPARRTVRVDERDFEVTVNGRRGRKGVFQLAKGANFLFAVSRAVCGHGKDFFIRIVDPKGLRLANPAESKNPNPWCFVPVKDFDFIGNDMVWDDHHAPERDAKMRETLELLADLLDTVRDARSFKETCNPQALDLPANEMVCDDAYLQFEGRALLGDAGQFVEDPEALMADNAECTTVLPCRAGDIELLYDLGAQSVGYYDFELSAPGGAIVDIFSVEHIESATGRIQFTGGNRNGMRHICREGLNRFTSLKRRSGRYLFVTVRGASAPVRIRNLRLIESTYPVARRGAFECSDSFLNRVWEISAHTLKLCMEDSFTDCPLYEQTLWVGDARNEAVFAYTVYGAEDMARRCLEVAGQSLGRYPLVGCQVPSSWDCILPAWSFLWGVAVWDHYERTADLPWLRRIWPKVLKNIAGAESLTDGRGLFSAPMWNMFDWSGIDQSHLTVTHNTMLLVGAIDAAVKCAGALGDGVQAARLRRLRKGYARAANALWDETKGAYPDAVRDDGTPSPLVCQHTSFLSVLYDIVEARNAARAIANVTDPPEAMTPVGSPFAAMYLYEALEKIGRDDLILDNIRREYEPMVRAGATTVWEVFPRTGSFFASPGWQTRSHCHAWSSAPVHFLNRIVLGIRQTAVGCAAYDISPRVTGLDWARGATATPDGAVKVQWERDGDDLRITAAAPPGVKLRYVPNPTHGKCRMVFNGRVVKRSESQG